MIKTIKEKQFSKILVPIDGSDQSMKAADYAIEIAIKHNAQLVVLHVIHIPPMYYPYRRTLSRFLADSRLQIQQYFDKILAKIKDNKNIQVKIEVIDSSMPIHAVIVNYAEHKNIDLIVIGTRGRSGFAKLLLGSVASEVLKMQPVL